MFGRHPMELWLALQYPTTKLHSTTVTQVLSLHCWSLCLIYVLPIQEIFGPVLAVYPYPDNDFRAAAKLANETSPYGLTAAIFVHDQSARNELCEVFRQAAGNFYINDKSTGSVVGQQPFGGARLSGEGFLFEGSAAWLAVRGCQVRGFCLRGSSVWLVVRDCQVRGFCLRGSAAWLAVRGCQVRGFCLRGSSVWLVVRGCQVSGCCLRGSAVWLVVRGCQVRVFLFEGECSVTGCERLSGEGFFVWGGSAVE